MVIKCTISTSRTKGARSINASIRTSGSAHPGWMYTRMPDSTQRKASAGLLSFLLYSTSHDMTDLLRSLRTAALPTQTGTGLEWGPLTHGLFVTDGGVITGAVEELLKQLQHL